MNTVEALRRKFTSHDGDGTPTSQATTSRKTRHCKVALVGSFAPHVTHQIENLLHRRLLTAGLITFCAFAAYLIWRLASPLAYGPETTLGQVDLSLHATVVAVLGGLSLWLWVRPHLCLDTLRWIELALFGSAGAYFAWLQFILIQNPQLRELVANGNDIVAKLAASANGMRWFTLMVIYGTFIPNTWRRCAAVMGLFILTPLALMTFNCWGCTKLGPFLPDMLTVTCIQLALGAAVAIFGSYKISSLQQEAFEARALGQYRLKKKLGAGGMGEVYLAEHVLLRRPCAIKLIRPDQAGDPTNLSRFEREVQTMATLTHWNTVEVFDYGHAEDGTFYYVMEYLPGLSLQELVDDYGPPEPARVVHFLRQMCAALHEAHSIGMIHRDIKPSNVLVCQRGGVHDVAKLLDFGLVQPFGLPAQEGQKLTMQGTILGSPPYMSPEQAVGNSELDARSDIYSLGSVAYFLLTGQPPFPRDTSMQILMAHVYEQVTPLQELRRDMPADLEEIVLKCLKKNPSQRYPDVEALDQALAACQCAAEWTRPCAAAWWKEYGARRKSDTIQDVAALTEAM
jgi:serine/threonine-protein kinase